MKHIVVIGGGVAGKKVVSDLLKIKDIKITLVEPKDYFEVPYAQLRAMVDGGAFSSSTRALYSTLLNGVTHIKKKALGVEKNKVLLEGDTSLSFDYLVIATGASFPTMEIIKGIDATIEKRNALIEKEAQKIKKSKSILIIGGGSVGVELAGEIAYEYPMKTITLVEAGSRLLGSLSESMSKRASSVLDEMKVHVVTNTRVQEKELGIWIDQNKKKYRADLVYKSVGMQQMSEWIKTSSEVELNDKGAIKVDSSLRSVKNPSIFILGDVNDVPEIKVGMFATMQAVNTVKNIKKLLANSNASLSTYSPKKPMGMVPIGKKKGAVQVPFMHPHFLIAIKQKDLLVKMSMK